MGERYTIEGRLGEGGAGLVYRAFDTQLQRPVAIKRLLDGETGEAADRRREELQREASLLCAVQHPNICQVFDYGVDEDGGFVVMELIQGDELSAVAGPTVTPRQFMDIAEQVLDGVAEAHAHSILHRDLKAANIMVNWLPGGSPQVKILDFGLAKFSLEPSQQTIDQETHSAKGSIHFMAPEQFEHRPLDARTDVYSLGCLFFLLLTGKHPFNGATMPEIMTRHLGHQLSEPLEQLRPDVPEALRQWVGWLMNRQMEDRPASAVEALRVLREIRPGVLRGAPTGTAVVATGSSPVRIPTAMAVPVNAPPVPPSGRVVTLPPPQPATVRKSTRRPRGRVALAVAAGAVVASGVLFVVLHQRGEQRNAAAQAAPPSGHPPDEAMPVQEGLVLWFDAAKGTQTASGTRPARLGEPVDHWQDQAGALAGDNAAIYHTITGTPAAEREFPTAASAHDGGLRSPRPVLKLNGGATRLVSGRGKGDATGGALGSSFDGKQLSCFFVARATERAGRAGRLLTADVGGEKAAWSLRYGPEPEWRSSLVRPGGARNETTLSVPVGEFAIVSALWDAGRDFYRSRALRADGKVVGWNSIRGPFATGPMPEVRFGSYPGRPEEAFRGEVAEVLVYNRCLSTEEAAAVERYLRGKYFP